MDIDRRRAAMVLFELERALGSFVSDISRDRPVEAAVTEKIIVRELARTGVNLKSGSMDDLVRAAYLEELLQIAVLATKGSGQEASATRLKSICDALEIFEVRNACAHPLRDFPRQYWFKVAVVASDHSLIQLGLNGPISALAAAEADSLSEPPADWLEKFSWELPNNLPSRVDHELTGLIGRRGLQRKLLDLIHNERNGAIAIVARGGVGKTALALEVLRGVVLDPKEAERFDSVVYISMKDEFLTVNGVERIAAARTRLEVEEAIVQSVNDMTGDSHVDFNELVKSLSNEKLLLCLDNLESVLRDQPDFFQMLNSVLPAKWRLLMTSRVRVDGALSMPIDDLEASDAEALAHRYARLKGLPLPSEMAGELTRLSRSNPLALKLTVDLMATGADLYKAAETAASEIVQFAYDKLVEALSEVAVKMLEVVFVSDGCSRADFVGALRLDSDSVAEGVSELTNTSLITRELGEIEERFHLNESVRDFMRINPRNLRLRSEVEAGVKRNREVQQSALAEQERMGIHSHAIEYVPPGLPAQLAELAFSVNRVFKKSDKKTDAKQIGLLIEKFRAFEAEFSRAEVYWRFFGRLMSKVDTSGAISLLSRAKEVDASKPQARALQGWLYLKIGRAADAVPVFSGLVSEGWSSEDRAGERFGSYVRLGYLRSLVFNEQFGRVLEETAGWRDARSSIVHEGVARMAALRQNDAAGEEKAAAFKECLSIIDWLVREKGYTKDLCAQAVKLYKDAAHWMQYRDLQKEAASLAIDSMAKHLAGMSTLISRGDLIALGLDGLADSPHVSSELAERVRALRHRVLGIPILLETALAKSGYKVVEVSSPPRVIQDDIERFLFAKDRDGQDYYVNIDSLKNGGWVEWSRLQRGEQLVLKTALSKKPGKAPMALETFLVSSKIDFLEPSKQGVDVLPIIQTSQK